MIEGAAESSYEIDVKISRALLDVASIDMSTLELVSLVSECALQKRD